MTDVTIDSLTLSLEQAKALMEKLPDAIATAEKALKFTWPKADVYMYINNFNKTAYLAEVGNTKTYVKADTPLKAVFLAREYELKNTDGRFTEETFYLSNPYPDVLITPLSLYFQREPARAFRIKT